jgi:hypothetical protein
MRVIILLKLLVASACIYFSIHIILSGGTIEQSINEQYHAFASLKNDPARDSAINRKILVQRRRQISGEINRLSQKRYPTWLRFLPILLTLIAGKMLSDIYFTLFKRRSA